jgi:hypothetical protein
VQARAQSSSSSSSSSSDSILPAGCMDKHMLPWAISPEYSLC